MNSVQRTIKYVATAFAILLAVGIITAITSLVINVVSLVSGKPLWEDRDRIDFSQEFTGVQSISISNSTGDLYIVPSDTFQVEASNVLDSFKAKVSSSGTLIISEESFNPLQWINFGNMKSYKSKITVYIPEDFIAKKVSIDSGAGNVVIDALKTKQLILDAGAGNISGSYIEADDVEIDGGVGNITLTEVRFNHTDIDNGVGNLRMEGILLGENRIDCGVGDVNLNLVGREEEYNIKIDSGVGNIRVNGTKVKNINSNQGAKNSIHIDGGVGNVSVDINN